MGLIKQIYVWSEKTFWNSLTKKLFSFLLLGLVNLVYLGIYQHQRNLLGQQLSAAGVPTEIQSSALASLDSGFHLMLWLTVAALIWTIGQILYLRFLIVRPVNAITLIFDEIARGEGDFSRNLPSYTHDELRQLAESYNRFADKMRQIISEVRKASVNIAQESVLVSKHVSATVTRATQQGEIAQQVFESSSESTRAIHDVSDSTDLISESTTKNLDKARQSCNEMLTIADKVEGVRIFV